MVVDIRKDLLQRKPKSSTPPPRNPNLVSELGPDTLPPEELAGPFSSPLHYNPLVFNVQNSLSREAQPRPLRVPCSACTFVPCSTHYRVNLALSRSGSRCRSHTKHSGLHPARAGVSGSDEEPCVEDIAGDRHSFTDGQHVAPPQPIKVACRACTSSLRAPVFHGRHAATNKMKPRKRGTCPDLCAVGTMMMETTTGCPAQDLPDDCARAAAADYGWFVRPEQADSSSAMAEKPVHSAAREQKKGFNHSVPVEVSDFDRAERVEGNTAYESFVVTYQATCSCEPISDTSHEEINLATAGKAKHDPHDCFVKRVQRACAKMRSGSKSGIVEIISTLPSASRRDQLGHGVKNPQRRQRRTVSSLSGNPLCNAPSRSINGVKDRASVLYEDRLPVPAAASDHSAARGNSMQADSDNAPFCMTTEKLKEDNYGTVKPWLHDGKETPPDNMQTTTAVGQLHDHEAKVEQADMAATAVKGSKKLGQKMSICKAAEMKKGSRTASVDSSAAVQTCMKRNDGGEEEAGEKDHRLQLSVEVFPSPSAEKGFGLKIVQHVVKNVEVQYVNGLGLSPRSFQTVTCESCASSCLPPPPHDDKHLNGTLGC